MGQRTISQIGAQERVWQGPGGRRGISALRQESDSVRKRVQILTLDQVPALLADIGNVQDHLHGEAVLNAQTVVVCAGQFWILLERWLTARENVPRGLPQLVHAAVENLRRKDDRLNVRKVRAVVVVAAVGLLGDAKTTSKGRLSIPEHVVGKSNPGRHLHRLLRYEATRKTRV